MTRKKSCSVSHAVLLIAGTVLFGCVKEPAWKFNLQIVDEAGVPLSKAAIEVKAVPNAHNIATQIGLAKEKLKSEYADGQGNCELNCKGTAVFLRISNPGYVSKDFILVGRRKGELQEITRVIMLTKSHLRPPPDDFDLISTGELDFLEFEGEHSSISINFLTGSKLASADTNTTIVFSLSDRGLHITANSGGVGKALPWESALTVDSWKQNNEFFTEDGLVSEFMLSAEWHPGKSAPSGGFVVKTDAYWIRAFVFTVGPKIFRICFDLSKDNFFVPDVNKGTGAIATSKQK